MAMLPADDARGIDAVRAALVSVDGTGATAFEVGVQELSAEPASDKFKSKRQHLHVYEKQADGEWKIAAAMSGNQ